VGSVRGHFMTDRGRAYLGDALAAVGLVAPRPVVVLVGGAAGLSAAVEEELRPLFTGGLVPALESLEAVAVDGGTRSGVMALLGEARSRLRASFPLVGVAADGTVRVPGDGMAREDAADLEPHHTHVVLVPGQDWGAESPWIAQTATALAAGGPSVTVVVNGGDIAYEDVRRSVDARRPVLAVTGTGRTADELGAALAGRAADERADALAHSGLVRAVPATDPVAVRALLERVMGGQDVG
jgi:SLOG in TRPM, prokaryote